jgi:hypothetical protein
MALFTAALHHEQAADQGRRVLWRRRMALPKTLSRLTPRGPHALYEYMHAQVATCDSVVRAAGFTSCVVPEARTRRPGSLMHPLPVNLFRSDYPSPRSSFGSFADTFVITDSKSWTMTLSAAII